MSAHTDGRVAPAPKAREATSPRKPARHVHEHRPTERRAVTTRPERHHIPGCNPDATPC
jgi:hypothetical protein